MNGTLYPEGDTLQAIKLATTSHELALKDFFQAWPIPVPILAERLRRAGYHLTSQDLHDMVTSPKDSENHMGDYALRVVLLEIRNDINKVI